MMKDLEKDMARLSVNVDCAEQLVLFLIMDQSDSRAYLKNRCIYNMQMVSMAFRDAVRHVLSKRLFPSVELSNNIRPFTVKSMRTYFFPSDVADHQTLASVKHIILKRLPDYGYAVEGLPESARIPNLVNVIMGMFRDLHMLADHKRREQVIEAFDTALAQHGILVGKYCECMDLMKHILRTSFVPSRLSGRVDTADLTT